MHGRGFHPDWPEVVGPLRTELAEHGWETLSLQMPVLEKTARYYDYVPILPAAFPRIRAGLAYLRARGADLVVLAAHSCSVHMVMEYVRRHGDGDFDAFIGIGMGATDYRQPMREPLPLETMSVPVLDIFGEEDYPAVRREASSRLAAIRAAGNLRSAQRIVSGADHFFHDRDEDLVEAGRAMARDPCRPTDEHAPGRERRSSHARRIVRPDSGTRRPVGLPCSGAGAPARDTPGATSVSGSRSRPRYRRCRPPSPSTSSAPWSDPCARRT